MSNNKEPSSSTIQSYVDQAVGAAQSALGSLTGSTADKVRQNNHMCIYTV